MSSRQPIEVCVECATPFLDRYAIEVGERGRRPRRCPSCRPVAAQTTHNARRRESGSNREYMREYRKRAAVRAREVERQQTEAFKAAALERRAARKLQQYATSTERIYRRRVFERDGGRCHLCRKKVDPRAWHLDHIVPLALGGSHTYENVAVSHPECNRAKGTRAVGEQLRVVG
jgi:5-methylcytosine-specific restriction endonuclease McrA